VLFCLGLALVNAVAWLPFALARRAKPAIAPASSTAKVELGTIILFASVGTFAEWLRSWLLSGFPWLYIGYSQTNAALDGWAPLGGVYAISFIIYASGATLFALSHAGLRNLRRPSHGRLLLLATALLACWIAGPQLAKLSYTQSSTAPRQVSLIQANISQHEKWRPGNLAASLKLYAQMSSEAWPRSELVIWPEAAIANEYHASEAFLQRMDNIAQSYNSALLTGIPFRDLGATGTAMHNSVTAVGHASGTYHKQRLVPFGEYIPLERWVGKLMAVFDLPMTSMGAGAADQAPIKVQDWQTQPLICYEVVYPSLAAAAARRSDVLVTVSNDAWFGASLGPLQHLQMAQMRAIETGRYVLRATGNGISAVIDARGTLLAKTDQFERSTLHSEFYTSTGLTPWTRAGYWLIPLANLLLLLALLLRNYWQRRRDGADAA
ncbi:MAG: apolipoprotein N-acyltransferase, partial [Gammaproteobacteria bacterium]|nr:apolipoprotein N-acyltransferase [Gammaproteobacteria bacterium]